MTKTRFLKLLTRCLFAFFGTVAVSSVIAVAWEPLVFVLSIVVGLLLFIALCAGVENLANWAWSKDES